MELLDKIDDLVAFCLIKHCFLVDLMTVVWVRSKYKKLV